MRRWRPKVLAAAGVAVVLALAAGLAAYVYLRRSLPEVNGTIAVAGLTAPVEIVRDREGVPHIYAGSRLDALYALGYAHAQDRLWQMEFQRRIGFGRLSEIFGAVTVPQDRFLRTVGFGRAARAAWTTLPDETRQQVDAYIAGINAFLETHHGSALPPEFTLLRYEPEPWQGPDVLVWIKMMQWDLSANYSFELVRHDLLEAVGPAKLAELMPPAAPDALSILSKKDMPWLAPTAGSMPADRTHDAEAYLGPGGLRADRRSAGRTSSWSDAFQASLSDGAPGVADLLLSGTAREALGSNNWVVDGTLTASGKPLLANDPHLTAKIPSTWYLAQMTAPGVDVVGATFPGLPAVAIGRNRFIAWGETNVAADVQDLYRERLDPTGRFAEFRGQMEPLQVVTETIPVKGGAEVPVAVRITRHGPLVSDAINATNETARRGRRPAPLEPLAFRWTALEPGDTTLTAFMRLNVAKNWPEFTSALGDLVAPSQNFVYADVDGHIGYYAPGRIPIRAKGDGSLPAEGWTGDAEWTGWIGFDQLPHTYDPPEHFIATANNQPAPGGYPYLITVEWDEPYRAQRITDLLHKQNRFRPDDFVSIQADTLSLHASSLLPLLLKRASPRSQAAADALGALKHWDYNARRDSAAAALFQAWFLHLTPELVGDELEPRLTGDYRGRSRYVSRFLARTLSSPDSAWCDDLRTTKRETCDDAVSSALDAAVADLSRRLGSRISGWRWDAVHVATFPHQGLDSVGLLRPWLSRRVANGGDWSTIDVGTVSAEDPYEQHSVAGYRQVIDLSRENDSRFLDAVGQSGHPLSTKYDDALPDWGVVRLRHMRMDRPDVERAAMGHLRLVPAAR